MALALLCALACAQSSGEAGQYEGNAQPDYWYWAAKIRSDVKERSTFDKVVPPKSSRESTSSAKFGGHYSDAGTDVKIGVRFFKVMAVEAAKGTMKLKVWLRYSWVDARLAWEPEEYGGVTTVYYQAMAHPGNEDNEIWIPDLQPYNAEVGIQHTLDTGYARVSHDGSVFYSRPGTLETLCKFSGLVAFPFDQLRCQLEFGGWLLSGAHQGIQLDGEGYQFSLQEASSGTSYQEYTIKAVNVSYAFYAYDCCPSEPWPVVIYAVELDRASTFYYTILLLPGILITLLSFVVFWADTDSSDALSFGVSIIVVNVLLNVVIIHMLPVCGELLWIDLFSAVNTFFCCTSLAQSAFMIMLENHASEHLSYAFLNVGARKVERRIKALYRRVRGKGRQSKKGQQQQQQSAERRTSAAAAGSKNAGSNSEERHGSMRRGSTHDLRLYMVEADDANSDEEDRAATNSWELRGVVESVAGLLYRHHPDVTRSIEVDGTNPRKARLGRPRHVIAGGAATEQDATPEERMRKFVAFETLFYKIDNDANHSVSVEECDDLLSFCAVDLDPTDRRRIFANYDVGKDKRLSRMEFCMLCRDVLWHIPIDVLHKMGDNLIATKAAKRRAYQRYWTDWGERLEKVCRLAVPLIYILALIIIFNLDMRDNYLDSSETMFEGASKLTSFTTPGWIMLVVYGASVLLCLVLGYRTEMKVKMDVRENAQLQRERSRQNMADATKRVQRERSRSLEAAKGGNAPKYTSKRWQKSSSILQASRRNCSEKRNGSGASSSTPAPSVQFTSATDDAGSGASSPSAAAAEIRVTARMKM